MPRGIRSWARALAAVAAAVALVEEARAEGLSLFLEPSFTTARIESYDQVGNGTQSDVRALLQNYRLSFDRTLTPAFAVSAGLLYEGQRTWSTDPYGSALVDGNLKGAYARLNLTLPTINGGVSYNITNRVGGGGNSLTGDDLSLFGSWRPMDLPELDVRIDRTHQYDLLGSSQDVITWSALLNLRYLVNPFEFRYALQWARPEDTVTGTTATSLDQTLQAIYSDRIFSGRSAVYVALTLRNQLLRTIVQGNGVIVQQQFPVAGLSLVEVPPAEPTNVTLAPNPALIDGNLTAGASLDIGFAPSQAGDSGRRDMGVQLADLVTTVNVVQIYVDRRLPPEITTAYTWTAYRSDDNRTWTPVAITGPVIFGAFLNRFEIPIQDTQARYVKVVTQPLPANITVDPAFANVLVTEMQVYLARPADSVPQESAVSGALLTANASTLLWRAANLNWDINTRFERRTNPGISTWSILNSLTASQWLARNLQLSERLARQDGDQGLGHEGQTDWSAGLAWRPLPTFMGSLTYSGQFVDARPILDADTGLYVSQPYGFNHSVTSLARADLYEGVSVLLTATGSLLSLYTGTNTWTGTANLSTTLVPNPWLTLTVGYTTGLSIVMVPDEPSQNIPQARIDSTVTVRPTNALSAVATISRILSGGPPSTFGTVQLNWSPLQGDLLLSVGYNKIFDTAAQSTIESFAPTLRWNVRPGIQVTATYTLQNNVAPVGQRHVRAFNVGLSLLL